MIRIKRDLLDACVSAFMKCAEEATDCSDLKILFKLDQGKAEAAVLGALSIVAPNGGPATAADVYFVTGYGTDCFHSWPPERTRS